MHFTIITPSFKQLDWLRLCVASVRDQVLGANVEGQMVSVSSSPRGSKIASQVSSPRLSVEHVIQDAGSPGIEDFASEIGADFFRDGQLVFQAPPSPSAPPPYRLAIYCEKDKGMYDAINRGLEKTTGEICAWLNSDEQYLDGTLLKVAAYFEKKPEIDVLLGDALLLNGDCAPVCYRRIMVPSRWHTQMDHLHSLSCAMFFKRDVLPVPAFSPNWRIIGDAVLIDYWIQKKRKFYASRDLLSTYAFTGDNLSRNNLAHQEHRLWRTRQPLFFLNRGLAVVCHRIRRLLHGSYTRFSVDSRYYTHADFTQRTTYKGNISGYWPKNGSSRKVDDFATHATNLRDMLFCSFQRARSILKKIAVFLLSSTTNSLFTRIQFAYKLHTLIDLYNPRSLNEKLQWLKLFYRDELIFRCANKQTVRGYISETIGDQFLIPLKKIFVLGDVLSLETLPTSFILKAGHASGWNCIVADKELEQSEALNTKITGWLQTEFFDVGREWMYKDSPRAVLCEELLIDNDGRIPRDYKFFCFHGEPRFIQVDYARFDGHTRTLYDMNWRKIPCSLEYPIGPDESGRPPVKFSEMIEVARKLSKPFPFVRVDLYSAKEKIWFGELTFCPGKGCERFTPRHYDRELGRWLDIDRIKCEHPQRIIQ